MGPVLTWTTDRILKHVKALADLPGAKVLFGGKPLQGHTIPECYGAVEPTAVFVPLDTMLRDKATFELCTTELFGPFQVVTEVCVELAWMGACRRVVDLGCPPHLIVHACWVPTPVFDASVRQ